MSQGFIQIPRSLLEHPAYTGAPPAYRCVLITILQHACFLPCQQYDHGKIIDLLPGQFMCSERRLEELANVEKNEARRAIQYFARFKIVKQEVKQRKQIISIIDQDTYDLIKKYSEARSEASVKQERSKSEAQKDNVDTADTEEKKKKKLNKEKVFQEKILIREWVSLTQIEIDKIFHLHGKELANEMLEILDSYNTSRQECYKSDYGALKTGGWVHKEALKRKTLPRPYNAGIDRRTKNIDGTPVASPIDGRF